MAIEQFIDNEVKSNDVVLFMKGTPQFPMCGFSGQVIQILDHLGVAPRAALLDHRGAIDLVHRVYLEGAGLERLLPDLWPLAVMALVTLWAASWMFRHRLT